MRVWLARFGKVFVPILLVLLLVVGIGYVKLAHSPISLGFLIPSIEKGIGSELGGLGVTIGKAELVLVEHGKLELRLRNLRLTEADGDQVATAPLAAIELSDAALWSFQLVPARIDFIAPRFAVAYTATGEMTLSLADTNEEIAGSSTPQSLTTPADHEDTEIAKSPQRFDLVRDLRAALARARQRRGASSYLRAIGVRDAEVTLDVTGVVSSWSVPRATVNLRHSNKRSHVTALVEIVAPRGSWELKLAAQQIEGTDRLRLEASVQNVFPSAFAGMTPALSGLQNIDVPIAASVTVDIVRDTVAGARIQVKTGEGSVSLPAFGETGRVEVGASQFVADYDPGKGQFVLAPSRAVWGQNYADVVGSLQSEEADGTTAWVFDLSTMGGQMTVVDAPDLSLPIDAWATKGRIVPAKGLIQFDTFALQAGGGHVDITGEMAVGKDGASSSRFTGVAKPMSVRTAKILWPQVLSPETRAWFFANVTKGAINGGRYQYADGVYVKTPVTSKTESVAGLTSQVFLQVDASNVEVATMPDMLPVLVPKGTLTIENNNVAIAMPEMALDPGQGRRVVLRDGRYVVKDMGNPNAQGVLSFTLAGAVAPVLDLLETLRKDPNKPGGLKLKGVEGKIDGRVEVIIPLSPDPQAASVKSVAPLSGLKIDGTARVTDVRAKDIVGPYDVQGATIDFTFNEQAVDAKGEMLLDGVLTQLNWQRIFDAPPELQPPLRLTADLSNADRNLLGIDVNHIVQGDIPIELIVTLVKQPAAQPLAVKLRADLTGAEIILEGLAWRKPPGRTALLECDMARDSGEIIKLENFRIAGDGLSIKGEVTFGAGSRLSHFVFPEFALDVVTQLSVEGALRPDNVLAVKARGTTFDGRNFFRALFSVGKITEKDLKPQRARAGLDVEVEIATVVGFSEMSLRNVKLKMSKRADKLTALDARGTLDGDKAITIVLKQAAGKPPLLEAVAGDAGQTFKLMGFYANVRGGQARLEVNLEGRGPAEKTGTLYVQDFEILGDPVVNEVFTGGIEPGTPATGRAKPRLVRQTYAFEEMRAAFSVGHGQFVIEDAQLRGPLVGASLRGTVDYGTNRLDLGGTYIPLQGFSNLFEGVPLFDPLLRGTRGEGIFGINFTIRGPMAQPQVLVNPLSLVTFGVFREIFPMSDPNPRVRPRAAPPAKPAPAEPAKGKAKTKAKPDAKAETKSPRVLDPWSSETTGAPE